MPSHYCSLCKTHIDLHLVVMSGTHSTAIVLAERPCLPAFNKRNKGRIHVPCRIFFPRQNNRFCQGGAAITPLPTRNCCGTRRDGGWLIAAAASHGGRKSRHFGLGLPISTKVPVPSPTSHIHAPLYCHAHVPHSPHSAVPFYTLTFLLHSHTH